MNRIGIFSFLVGHAVGQQLFTDLSNDLKGIISSIDDHGQLIVNKLADNQAAESLEHEVEEDTNKHILAALEVKRDILSVYIAEHIVVGNELCHINWP